MDDTDGSGGGLEHWNGKEVGLGRGLYGLGVGFSFSNDICEGGRLHSSRF